MFLAFLLINLSRSKVSDEGYICIVEYILFMILWLPVFNWLFFFPLCLLHSIWCYYGSQQPQKRDLKHICASFGQVQNAKPAAEPPGVSASAAKAPSSGAPLSVWECHQLSRGTGSSGEQPAPLPQPDPQPSDLHSGLPCTVRRQRFKGYVCPEVESQSLSSKTF